MERFTYGPLVYNLVENSDTNSDNYYWNGFPPVGYDKDDVPIDKEGMQCLPWTSPLHPQHKPTEFIWNNSLREEIPTLESFRSWFEENFLAVTDRDLAFYIVRWMSKQRNSDIQQSLFANFSYMDVDTVIDTIWPELTENAN